MMTLLATLPFEGQAVLIFACLVMVSPVLVIGFSMLRLAAGPRRKSIARIKYQKPVASQGENCGPCSGGGMTSPSAEVVKVVSDADYDRALYRTEEQRLNYLEGLHEEGPSPAYDWPQPTLIPVPREWTRKNQERE